MRLVLSALFLMFSLNAHAQEAATPYARFADLALACVMSSDQDVAPPREWDDPRAKRWQSVLEPLEQAYVANMKTWLAL